MFPEPANSPEALSGSKSAGESGGSDPLAQVLETLRESPRFSRSITCWHTIPEQPAQYAPMPEALDGRLVSALEERGIDRLYSHQAEAVGHALAGRDITVVTPTASGKSLCYHLPVIQSILVNPQARALFLFPTKALSQDQFSDLYALTGKLNAGIKVYTFDGDTPDSARRAIRSAGQIVITNPDMLHSGILPHHTLWIKLFENLRWIVIDEIHTYRGVFGSHVANVMRRLKRICDFYRSKPQFICCSATIANPDDLAQELTGRPMHLIATNGAPRGRKTVIFYNPPVVNAELGIRRSSVKEVQRLAMRFIERDLQTIVFAPSRLRVEILTTYLRRGMARLHRNPDQIKGYRGGYLPNERRAIEQGVKKGEVLGIVSTNALELGIDIGQLRVAILCGYPGSIASTWQQAGRAGRSNQASAVIVVGTSSPLNQFIINHPEFFLGAPAENGIVNPNNIAILAGHIKCGTFELPFNQGEPFGAADPEPILSALEESRIVRHANNRYFWAEQVYPAEEISLRSATVDNFVVLDTTRENSVLAEVDYDSAPFLIHTEAIYLHQSHPFYVEKLDWDRRTAYVHPIDTDYYTDAVAKTDIKVLSENEARQFHRLAQADEAMQQVPTAEVGQAALSGQPPGAAAAPALIQPLSEKVFGEVSVVTIVTKYKKIKFETHENVGYGDVHTPENEMQTEAYWLRLRPELKEELDAIGLDMGAGLRGIATLLANVVPLYVLCDRRDFQVVPMVRSPFDDRPAIYLYDQYPGGIGLARRVFAYDRRLLKAAFDIAKGCACAQGCPSCVGPAFEAADPSKRSAIYLIESILAQLSHAPEPE